MASRDEIESLIYLLEDPDPVVQMSVQNRFLELGENVVPVLDQFRSTTQDEKEKSLINDVIHSITFGSLYEDFSILLETGIHSRRDLEKGMFELSRFGSPTLRTSDYSQKLDLFANQIYTDIVCQPSEKHKMHTLLQFVFRELRFRGDDKDYHNPDNAFIDRVIDRRMGLPISLSMVIMFLARRLDLPFYGVNMPIHFMLIFQGEDEDVLIDPFDGGMVVSFDQCHYFLKKNGIDPRPEHFERTDYLTVFERAIRNLLHSYSRAGEESRVHELKELIQLVETSI